MSARSMTRQYNDRMSAGKRATPVNEINESLND